MDGPLDLLLVHAATTWALVGLIWIVQIVQYPGFALLGPGERKEFHGHHSRSITWVVAPLMIAELVSGAWLYVHPPAQLPPSLLNLATGLIAVNWIVTAFVAVPLHRRFLRDPAPAQRALVRSNWLRTACWSARGVLVLLLLRSALAS